MTLRSATLTAKPSAARRPVRGDTSQKQMVGDVWIDFELSRKRLEFRARLVALTLVVFTFLFWGLAILGLWTAIPWILERAFADAARAPIIMRF